MKEIVEKILEDRIKNLKEKIDNSYEDSSIKEECKEMLERIEQLYNDLFKYY